MKSIQTTEVFDAWYGGLKDRLAARKIQVRIDRAEDGNFGDCKSVGGGVSEMRIHHGPGIGCISCKAKTFKWRCKWLKMQKGNRRWVN